MNDNFQFGGWTFERELYEFLLENLPSGSTILELGSGRGTGLLSNHYNMISIEHDFNFIGKYNSKYIHAILKDGWYDLQVMEYWLPKLKYDCILIDGPPGDLSAHRIGFYNNIHLFDINKMMIFDDTNRVGEARLFELVRNHIPNRKTFFGKTFSAIL